MFLDFCIDIEKLLEVEKEVFDDLVVLLRYFRRNLLIPVLLLQRALLYIIRLFWRCILFCGGADADIYIDGTLYDFKCTKREGYVWKDVSQILGYYLLDCISKDSKDRENDLDKYEIRRIAFYKARFGEVEYYDVSRESYSQTIKEFEKIFWKYVRKREILKMI